MIVDDKIRFEKLQCNVSIDVTKILALSFGKIDKYEYLTSEEILPFNKRQILQLANLHILL